MQIRVLRKPKPKYKPDVSAITDVFDQVTISWSIYSHGTNLEVHLL